LIKEDAHCLERISDGLSMVNDDQAIGADHKEGQAGHSDLINKGSGNHGKGQMTCAMSTSNMGIRRGR